MMRLFGVGGVVEIRGLVKAAEHNGKCGRVVGFTGERYKVLLSSSKTFLAVKEENLVVTSGETCCPLCFEELALWHATDASVRLTCCGKIVCAKCGPEAENSLTSCPVCRLPLANTEEENLERLRRHADRGAAWACHAMGTLSLKGSNKLAAFEWFQKAADQGYLPAYHDLAECYRLGSGVVKCEKSYRHWQRRASDEGHAPSQYECALACEDEKKAASLLLLAASQGYALAQEKLADCYAKGIGVEANLRSCLKWRLLAAKRDDARAQHNLAVSLQRLRGGELTPAALYFLRRAADNGYADSLAVLPQVEDAIDSCCVLCGHTKKKFRCSRCQATTYCSTTCQQADYQQGHGRLCCDKDTLLKDFYLPLEDYL